MRLFLWWSLLIIYSSIFMKKYFPLSLLSLLLFIPKATFAFVPLVCDLCTIGVIAGLGISRYFGIDDSVTWVWIGAILVVLITMTCAYLEKKKINYRFRNTSVALLYIVFTYISFYYMWVIGMYGNTLWKINSIFLDKILVSSVVGWLTLTGLSLWYQAMKRKNDGHAYFPFQKVVMPIAGLTLMSIIFYFITAR